MYSDADPPSKFSAHSPTVPLPPWLVVPILAGSLAALAGGYWDDAWHTERGRDEFFIAPHIAIYGGISLAGAALVLWAVLAVRARGTAALRHRPLALALLGVGATLASGPIDNVWHLSFGRDSVIWSPPHTLGIVGAAALGAALLLELAGTDARWARRIAPAAAAFVLAALTFLVVEYETDVPQFDSVWYLPVLAFTSALALAVARRSLPGRWAAGGVAALHLAFVGAVSAALVVLGFDAPKLPLLVGAGLVLDLAVRSGRSLPVQALAYTAAVYLLYVPTLNWAGSGVQLDALDVVAGLPLALVAVFAALLAVLGQWRRAGRGLVGVAILMLGVIVPAPALGHDPGQGDEAGTMDLRVQARERRIELVAVPDTCRGLGSGQLVARRGGLARRSQLRRTGCRYSGEVTVPEEGRWFVYAELSRGNEAVEAWLPVKVTGELSSVAEPRRYSYVAAGDRSSAVKPIAGGVIYVLVLALLVGIVGIVRSGTRRGYARFAG